MDPQDADVARALLAWFGRVKRDLPWRREPREAYRVWVSEVMLQQTQVATVVPYFERFLARFPTVEALAAAPEADVMKAWEGLGYYSRARNLHAAAKALAARGAFPQTAAALAELPGFGPYTAGAVASLAFGDRAAAVDGNVLRVLSRLDADATDVTTPAARKRFEARALALQPPAAPGAFNEAMMELGALVCTPKSPRCGECPVAFACAARAAGRQDELPVKKRKAPAREVAVTAALVVRADGRLLLERRERGLLAGLWAPPAVEGTWDDLAAALRAAGVEGLSDEGVAGEVEHAFTHRKWRVAVHRARAAGDGSGATAAGDGGEWVAPARVGERALAGWARKAIALAGQTTLGAF